MKFRAIFFLLVFVSVTGNATDDNGYNSHTIRRSDIPMDAPTFEKFRVTEKFTGKIATPDVTSQTMARLFRTRIREGAKDGPNFAGHYTIVGWGCGTNCVAFAIVDARSGKVYFPNNFYSVESSNVAEEELELSGDHLVQYRVDSRLLVAIGGINENSALRGISYFTWENNRLRRIRFIHKAYE